jgi:capsular polysaccharide biosynthesis protein
VKPEGRRLTRGEFVEASEAFRRIFWRHRWLLLILMILPAVGIARLKEHQPVQYAATAIIQGQGTTPDATTQVSAIQSRVSAVATSPAVVQLAISQAKVNRSVTQVAKHEIAITPLSSSAIMVMTVTDASPQGAMALAGALAKVVVDQLNQLGIKDNPELAQLGQANAQLNTRRNLLLSELNKANASNASTSVSVQALLSQLGAAEQELATNQSESQQILATLTGETGASVVSVPTYATGASRHVAVDAALAALLGLVVALLFATLREVLRPTVAQPGAGARELGAVLFGSAHVRGNRIISLGQNLPERLSLAAHRAGVLAIILTGPGSPDRLAALAAQLRDAMPSPERADTRSARVLTAARLDHGHNGDDPSSNGESWRPAARTPKPQTTVVTLSDIRLGSPPPDAALVVVLPRFAPHSALDQAADLGVTADWPILGVIGIRRQGLLAGLIGRPAAASALRALDMPLGGGTAADTNPDIPVAGAGSAHGAAAETAAPDAAPPSQAAAKTVPTAKPVPNEKARAPEGNHQEGEHD